MSIKVFDSELYKCKAVLLEDDETVVHGYYKCTDGKDTIDEKVINPYSLCRNTGIKLKDGYIYEGDLIEYKSGLSDWEMGYIEWNDFNKCFAIRSSLNYSGKREIHSADIRIVGNIALCHDDMDKMQAYSDEMDKSYSPQPTIECRSKQHLNKQAKMILPK